nr:hypothetical protein [Campylobacter jejuni]
MEKSNALILNVKLDLARALKKYKLDDDYSSKAYVSFGKYF